MIALGDQHVLLFLLRRPEQRLVLLALQLERLVLLSPLERLVLLSPLDCLVLLSPLELELLCAFPAPPSPSLSHWTLHTPW